MSQNKDVDSVLKRTVEVAKLHNLRHVSTDHLFCALLENKIIGPFLQEQGARVDILLGHFDHKFRTDTTLERHVPGTDQVRTTSLHRVFASAKAQALYLDKEIPDLVDITYALLNDAHVGPAFCKLLDQAGANSAKILELLKNVLEGSSEPQTIIVVSPQAAEAAAAAQGARPQAKGQEVLNEFCTNMNELAKAGKIDPVVGREMEVEKILQTLGRKNKQNAILVGESGTGKTAIVDGLVQRIVKGDVPEFFKDAVIYSLDMGGLVAGTKFRGEFEERLKNIIDAIQKNPKNILFIDEIHMIRGAGSSSDNAMDASNILKPALANRSIRVIGATTFDEYRKHFEKDKALMRRFYKMDVNEPTVEETKLILRGAIGHFEKYHNVSYDVEALDLAVELAGKYMHDKKFPDKAFDVIDSVGSRNKLFNADHKVITVEDIEREVSIIVKIPEIKVKKDESAKLKLLETNLKSKIFGQDKVIEQLVNHVLVAKGGLLDPEKPLLSALFRGQTGVGKTELAKQLAVELNIPFVRFDMSEYQEKHSVSKFIGSPPGYVGHGEGQAGAGLLVSAIENTPHCVLLLDEIEKADPQVLNVLLQVLDYGMLTSSTGKTASFRNAIIIMSANLGAKMMDKSPIGFGRDKSTNTHDVDATNDFFAPEMRNRIDMTVSFNTLNSEIMNRIIDKFIAQTNTMLATKGITIELTETAKQFFVDQTIAENLGARPLNRMITEKIKQPLSKKILFESVPSGTKIIVDAEDGEVVFLEPIKEEVTV